MLADKTAFCPTDGLNQKFRIRTIDGRKGVTISPPLTAEDKSEQILKQISVDVCCDDIWNSTYEFQGSELTFYDLIETYGKHYQEDNRIKPILKKECASCEFVAKEKDKLAGLKSGRVECWKECLGWADADFEEPTILDIWNFRKKDEYLQAGIVKVSQLGPEDINAAEDGKPGLSPSQRQWLQVEKYQANDGSVWIDKENLKREMDKWFSHCTSSTLKHPWWPSHSTKEGTPMRPSLFSFLIMWSMKRGISSMPENISMYSRGCSPTMNLSGN
jgi:hypothetical protein